MNRVGCHYLNGLPFIWTGNKFLLLLYLCFNRDIGESKSWTRQSCETKQSEMFGQIPSRKEIDGVFQGKGVDMETTDEDGDSLQEVARVMNRDGNFDAILTLLRSSLNNPKGAENFFILPQDFI